MYKSFSYLIVYKKYFFFFFVSFCVHVKTQKTSKINKQSKVNEQLNISCSSSPKSAEPTNKQSIDQMVQNSQSTKAMMHESTLESTPEANEMDKSKKSVGPVGVIINETPQCKRWWVCPWTCPIKFSVSLLCFLAFLSFFNAKL